MEADRERIRCFDCGVLAPSTTTNYTLIGGKHGWRLTRVHQGDAVELQWRCPKCWARHKSRIEASSPPPSIRVPSRLSRPPGGAASIPPPSQSNRMPAASPASQSGSLRPLPATVSSAPRVKTAEARLNTLDSPTPTEGPRKVVIPGTSASGPAAGPERTPAGPPFSAEQGAGAPEPRRR